jgi:hypothetical protein
MRPVHIQFLVCELIDCKRIEAMDHDAERATIIGKSW